jgi:hypothetical protein
MEVLQTVVGVGVLHLTVVVTETEMEIVDQVATLKRGFNHNIISAKLIFPNRIKIKRDCFNRNNPFLFGLN